MGGGGSYSQSKSKSESAPTLLPEQQKIWKFLTAQLIPQALGKETQATKIAAQGARDEGAKLLNLQQTQINQLANQGFGSAQRAQLTSKSQDSALQNTLQNILGQRAAAQQQAFGILGGLPIQPGTKSKARASSMSVAAKGGATGG